MKYAQPIAIGYRYEKVFQHLVGRCPAELKPRIIYVDDLLNDGSGLWMKSDGTLRVYDGIESIISNDAALFHRFFVRPEADRQRATKLIDLYRTFSAFVETMHSDAIVINRPRSGVLNFSKMAHMDLLASLGFQVPRALLSTHPKRALPFNGQIINKGCSGIRTIAQRVNTTDIAAMEDVCLPPVLLQDFVEGADVRVHFIGLEQVSLLFETKADDYRYAEAFGHDLRISRTEIKPDVLTLCWCYMKHQRLEFAGFDFKVTKDNQWYLLEVNPMPGFSYFDSYADFEISRLIWKSLAQGYSNTGLLNRKIQPFIDTSRRPKTDTG